MGIFKNFAKHVETKKESAISKLNDEIHNFSYENQKDVEYSYDDGNPHNDNDYGKTIFLNCFTKARVNDNYPGYITGECEIANPKKYLIKMCDEGYLKETDVYETLNAKTISELKKALKEQGLKQAGLKADLVARLLEESDLSMTNLLDSKYYVTTEKALRYLENHNDYLLLHKICAWEVNWREYDKKHIYGESFYETIRRIAIERMKSDNNSFGRNEYYLIYRAAKECEFYKEALDALLHTAYIDASGIKLKTTLDYNTKTKHELINDNDSFMYGMDIAPGIVKEMEELRNEYQDEMIEDVFKLYLPINMCSKDTFKSIVSTIMYGEYVREEMIDKLRKEYIAYIKKM